MTGIERIDAVLRGETPDYLPVVPQSFMFAAQSIGTRIGLISRSPAELARSHISCQEKYGYDGCVIDIDDASLAEACGAKVIWRENDVAFVDENHPVLEDLRDIDGLEMPDPYKSGRLCEWLEVTERLKSALGDHVWIMGRADQGPFSVLSLLRGAQNFMIDLLEEDEDVIRHALEWAAKAHIAFAKAQLSAGAHATSMGDSYASPELISPKMYRDFAFEYEKECVEAVQTDGKPYSVHICGDTSKIIADMGKLGARILEVDWKLDMGEARKIVPENTALMGNVDPSRILVQGRPEDVSDNVRRIIGQTLGKGIIISSGCAIGANTPPENFSALISAAREYGSLERLCELREKK
ncbi:MAG: uroporphyrinogen decarboxylase family protein [Christensenellaceae bacterium]|nr:uroporphyrinogen decarboxylase family protein [Christensenellaceae bacterium]